MLPVFAEADFVVVGAGSAGSFIAAKLAETEGISVVVIEAGPAGRNPLLSVPLLTGHFLRSGRYTWPFETTPQAHLDGRRLKWPRGRVVGGSGAINGMVWARGLPSDYDHWAQRGLLGWSWEKVEPVFQALEAMPEVGGGKALGIEQPAWWTELYDAFLTGAESVGCGRTDDFNGAFPSGVGRYQFNIRSGRRASTGALLQRAAARGRLRLLTDTHTLRLEIAEGRAQSVLVSRGGSSGKVVARREIILAAGTVGSPQILLTSGIGPGGDLAELGLPVHVDSPEVGRNLQDHLLVRVEHAATKPGGLNRLLRADRAGLALLNALIFGRGPAACFPLLVGGFLKSDPALAEPDLQSHFMPALTSATIRVNPFRAPPGMRDGDGFFANICQMRPHSRGSIKLASADTSAVPVIDPNYLSVEADRSVLRAGVRLLRRIFASPAFDDWRGVEIAPGADINSDDEVDAWVRTAAESVYHPVGTCRMGADRESVVDPSLRVRGVTGLRVADASVMPAITSANTNAPTVMIASRAADLVLDA
jgi:choline dehydrogenase